MYPKDYFHEKKGKAKKGGCFVIMPFASKFDSVYETFKTAVQSDEINLNCVRGDDLYQQHILQSILDQILESEFIIADLTDLNANVFYELGLVHAMKEMQKVVIVAQDTSFIPFDLKQFRCLIYETSKEGLEKLNRELKATFSEASRNSYRVDLKESNIYNFDKKLVGRDNNLYSFSIETPYIGQGLIKLIINFTEFRIDRPAESIESQYCLVSEDEPTIKLDVLPYTITFVEAHDHKAKISIDKITIAQ